jgi:hypothetical protein
VPLRDVRWLVMVGIAVLASACALSLSHRKTDNPKLHQVRKVFVNPPSVGWERELEVAERLGKFVTDAFAQRGFTLVSTASESDAAITVEEVQTIRVDMPRPDPPEYEFACKVLSSSLNIQWRTSIKKTTWNKRPDVERQSMERAAEKFFNAWKESAVRAGTLTAAQAKALKRIQ